MVVSDYTASNGSLVKRATVVISPSQILSKTGEKTVIVFTVPSDCKSSFSV